MASLYPAPGLRCEHSGGWHLNQTIELARLFPLGPIAMPVILSGVGGEDSLPLPRISKTANVFEPPPPPPPVMGLGVHSYASYAFDEQTDAHARRQSDRDSLRY